MITSTNGLINTNWGGEIGDVILYVPKNTSVLAFNSNDVFANFIGKLSTNLATEVNCSSCTSLTSLNAPMVTAVNCNDCTSLTSLNAPMATYVYADGCTSLTSLNAPMATHVYCYTCTSLTSLNAPMVTAVNCSSCTSLTSLNAPMATSVDCSDCALTAKTIGDFLVGLSVNFPTNSNTAFFSGGTNATGTQINTYLVSINKTLAGILAILTNSTITLNT